MGDVHLLAAVGAASGVDRSDASVLHRTIHCPGMGGDFPPGQHLQQPRKPGTALWAAPCDGDFGGHISAARGGIAAECPLDANQYQLTRSPENLGTYCALERIQFQEVHSQEIPAGPEARDFLLDSGTGLNWILMQGC